MSTIDQQVGNSEYVLLIITKIWYTQRVMQIMQISTKSKIKTF